MALSVTPFLRFAALLSFLVTASHGERGTYFLDPTNITIRSMVPDSNGDTTLGHDFSHAGSHRAGSRGAWISPNTLMRSRERPVHSTISGAGVPSANRGWSV